MEAKGAIVEIMAVLEKNQIRENTFGIFLSDNESHARDGTGFSGSNCSVISNFGQPANGVLWGFKADIWEAGHRVPFIVSRSNQMKGGQVEDRLVCQTDFYSTFSKIVGEPIKKSIGEDSFDFLFTDKNDREARKSLIMQNYGGDFAIREGNWKLLLNENQSIALFAKERFNAGIKTESSLLEWGWSQKLPIIIPENFRLSDGDFPHFGGRAMIGYPTIIGEDRE